MEHESTLPHETKTLDQLVSLLATGVLPAAIRKRSFIVNDVPKAMPIAIDEDTLASVLGGMLYSVINHTQDGCIRVSARQTGRNVEVQVNDSSIHNSETLAIELDKILALVKKMGGFVSIMDKQEEPAIVSFSFENVSEGITSAHKN